MTMELLTSSVVGIIVGLLWLYGLEAACIGVLAANSYYLTSKV